MEEQNFELTIVAVRNLNTTGNESTLIAGFPSLNRRLCRWMRTVLLFASVLKEGKLQTWAITRTKQLECH